MIGRKTWEYIDAFLDTLNIGDEFTARDVADYINDRSLKPSYTAVAISNIIEYTPRVEYIGRNRQKRYRKTAYPRHFYWKDEGWTVGGIS